MAAGARRVAGSDYALALTGIAGPTGGTTEKPVGLTYIALAKEGSTEVRRFVFPGDREFNRTMAALTALNWLRLELLQASHE
jgi:nicotinamide-nucleotide amidase